jgi:hypothetical protein
MTYMKRIIYILASLLPLMTGCSKSNSSATPEEFERYIFFSQGIDTKASLIESANTMGKFGVVGFKYDNDKTWANHKAGNPTPNVFYNDQGTLVSVEELTCSSDGSSSYTPLQGWSNISRYAFFAYYPIDKDNVTLVNTDGSAYTGGTPAIKYSMTSTLIRNDMADVMVAPAHTDMYWRSASETNVNGNDIKFSFQHCLASVGLHIKNSTSGSVTIKSAKIKVQGIRHQDIIIPLDGSDPTPSVTPITGAKTCVLAVKDAEQSPTSTGIELTDKLIFIPQTEYMTLTVTVEYTRSADGYTSYDGSFTSADLKTVLMKGRKSLVYLNFTDSNVEVKQDSGAWVEVPEVGNTFN